MQLMVGDAISFASPQKTRPASSKMAKNLLKRQGTVVMVACMGFSPFNIIHSVANKLGSSSKSNFRNTLDKRAPNAIIIQLHCTQMAMSGSVLMEI